MKSRFLALFCIFLGLNTQAKFGKYSNFGGAIGFSVMDNFAYGVRSDPNKMFISGSLLYGVSFNDDFNLLIGLDFQKVAPNNSRSDYQICNDGDASCLPYASSNQLFIPLGVEYYSNTNRSRFQSYYNLQLIPSFSFSHEMTILPFDKSHLPQTPYDKSSSGFKFENLYLSLGINNEIGINEKFKVFIEPSARYSLLFRGEDVVNPTYMIMVKVGVRYRKVKK